MTVAADPVRVIDADTHMTEASRPVDEARARVVEGSRPARRPRSTARRRGSSRRRRPRPRRRRRRRRQARQEGPLVRRPVRVGDRRRSTRPRTTPSRGWSCWTRSGIWAQIIFPGVVGLGGQSLGDIVQDVALRNALPRDLQRRQRRAAGRVRATGCCRWRSCPRGTSTRACAKRNAPTEPRSARREPHLGSAGPRCRPTSRTARGIRCGRRAARSSCRCTSTSAPASRR